MSRQLLCTSSNRFCTKIYPLETSEESDTYPHAHLARQPWLSRLSWLPLHTQHGADQNPVGHRLRHASAAQSLGDIHVWNSKPITDTR